MRIGNIEIPQGAILAPMAGITCVPFRRLCLEMGAAMTVTEMISADAVLRNATRHRQRIDKAPGERILAGQILARTPEQFASAARLLCESGADIIDLNFGCPSRKVVKTGGGCAFLKDTEKIGLSVRAVVNAVKLPVTVKMRAGWTTGIATAPEAARISQEEGAVAVFIHGRYREQVHSGPVDLEVIRKVKESVSIPVIGNGGIQTFSDAQRMLKETGCNSVMAGQGARTNPWIFAEIKSAKSMKPSDRERIDTVRKLLGYYVEYAGPVRAALEMRKYAAWLVRGMPGAVNFRKSLGQAHSPEILLGLLDDLE